MYILMQLSQCEWLRTKKSSWKQITDSDKQKQLFSQWIMWLMDEFVVQILKVSKNLYNRASTHIY